MAVGFPAKTTYADGDVFSASDINDTNGTLNLVNPATTPTVQANPILNSSFQVWQRGTSIAIPSSTGNTFSADRWTSQTGAAAITISRQLTSDTTNLPFIQYCARYQRNSGQTGTNTVPLVQNIETLNARPFAGKAITFSFYARRGANYSPTSNALDFTVGSGTGTDQNVLTSYTGEAAVLSGTATLTTTWQRFTGTGTVSASANEMYIRFNYSPTGTAGADDFYEVTGVQIDVGSIALPFRTYAGTIQGELAACQRYYLYKSGNEFSGVFSSSSTAYLSTHYPIMRVSPTVTIPAGPYTNFIDQSGTSFRTPTSITNYGSNQQGTTLSVSGMSGASVGHFALYVSGTFIQFIAEL
jgi:hypothetical protein